MPDGIVEGADGPDGVIPLPGQDVEGAVIAAVQDDGAVGEGRQVVQRRVRPVRGSADGGAGEAEVPRRWGHGEGRAAEMGSRWRWGEEYNMSCVPAGCRGLAGYRGRGDPHASQPRPRSGAQKTLKTWRA